MAAHHLLVAFVVALSLSSVTADGKSSAGHSCGCLESMELEGCLVRGLPANAAGCHVVTRNPRVCLVHCKLIDLSMLHWIHWSFHVGLTTHSCNRACRRPPPASGRLCQCPGCCPGPGLRQCPGRRSGHRQGHWRKQHRGRK